ncbi:MAG: Bug family tripartite tricarboxylate transporter substrate binding protein [Lautropia sp.]
MKTALFRFACVAACTIAPLVSQAQDNYPSRPVKILVGYSAGGATDVHARTMAEGLTKRLGQSFIVENRPGAAGMLAAQTLANSPADGYLLMMATSGAMAIPQNFGKLPYDPARDFVPVAQTTTNDLVMVVNNKSPVTNFAEFVKSVKAEPGKYSYGVSGRGSITHIAGERLKHELGLDLTLVPYRGDSAAMADTLGGSLPYSFVALSSIGSSVQAGSVRPLFVTGSKRLRHFPNIPTLTELGQRDFVMSSWIALFAPASTPQPIVQKLADNIRQVMADPEVIERLEKTGARVEYRNSEELKAFVGVEIKRFAEIIKAADIRAE